MPGSSIPAALGAAMEIAGLDIQCRDIPDVKASSSHTDPDVTSASRNLGMIDEESVGRADLSHRSPTPADLSSLSVVPAATELLVVYDHEGAIAKLVRARRNHDAVVVRGYGQISARGLGTAD